MKALKDAWTFYIECVEIMKKILRGSSTYHRKSCIYSFNQFRRYGKCMSLTHLSTTPTNLFSSPIVFKKTLPRPLCLLSPSKPMAQLSRSQLRRLNYFQRPSTPTSNRLSRRQHTLFQIICLAGLPRPPLRIPAIECIQRHLYFIPLHNFSQRAPYL